MIAMACIGKSRVVWTAGGPDREEMGPDSRVEAPRGACGMLGWCD